MLSFAVVLTVVGASVFASADCCIADERPHGSRSPQVTPKGPNQHGSLAIHLVASYEYLQCDNLCPPSMTCEDIDCDLSMVELEASGGYGYTAFVAYNIEQAEAVEFYVVGWPTAEVSPNFEGPVYCAWEAGYVVGEPFEKRGGIGGVAVFPCEQPCSGMFCFCTIAFGPEMYDWLPITIAYSPSQFSFDFNYFIDCSVSWVITRVFYEHPAVIGGTCDPIPNCEPGPTENDGSTWGGVKVLYR